MNINSVETSCLPSGLLQPLTFFLQAGKTHLGLFIRCSSLILFIHLFQQCANPGVVSGGPRDTIPPQLIYSYPEDETINFDDQTIILEFNEKIAADKIRQSLIISPTSKVKFKHFIKKNKITIEFEEPFQDTTTYTLNFFDAITDITEKNPPVNLILAFSTGDFIDSLKVFGTVHDLFSNKPVNKATVALYRFTDTLNIYEDIPSYFTATDKYGSFGINNIKYGTYKLLTFEDENRSLVFDEDEELYGFLPGYINPIEISDSLRLKSYQIDASELKVNSARISGRYYEMRYSKQIQNYSILATDTILTINSNVVGDKETIRFYNPFNGFPKDSIQVIIQSYDSLKNTSIDTTYIAFQESSRPKSEFSINAFPTSNQEIEPIQNISLDFSKPVKTWDLSNFKIRLDSIHSFQPDSIGIKWNHNYTKAYISSVINRNQIIDSVNLWTEAIAIDSLNPDTLSMIRKQLLEKYDKKTINLVIQEQTFISVEDDTSSVLDLKYKFYSPENRGTLKVNVNTDSLSYFIQLLKSPQNAVEQQLYNCSPCFFKNITPGKYSLRFLIDANQDSVWSIGNIRKDIPPEPIIHFPEQTEIRSNFDMLLDVSL